MKKDIFFTGFTLVELLGVIIVLGVIALITFPIVDKLIKDSKEQALERIIDNIEEAAYSYSVENDIGFPMNKTELSLNKIQQEGYLNTTIINPITNKELQGCVWYYWDVNIRQYIFEYDMECIKKDNPPEINIAYDESLINNNGWAKENVAVTLIGNGDVKYCISNSECEPNELIEENNYTKFITTEGISYVCAVTTNSLGSSDVLCKNINIDKTPPTISGVGDIIVDKNENVNLSDGVIYDDTLSQISGNLTISPSSIDTSVTGVKQVVYRVSDKAGNIREVVRRIIVDANAPTIAFSLVDDNAINSNGWANKNFYVRATINDNSGSGIKMAKSCSTNISSECTPTANFTGNTNDFYISVEGSNRICIEVTDNNDKTSKVCSDTYKLDKTAPVAGTVTLSGTLGSNNWYTTNVTINKVNGTDSLSGHSNTTSNISSIMSNTTGTTVTITTTDLAGNSSSRNYTIKVDKNKPTVTPKSGTLEITEGDSNVVSNYFNYSYSISGGSISCSPVNTNSLNVGTQTISCTAIGGNGLSATGTKQILVNAAYSFENDSWATIANNIKNGNASVYNVGDTKEVTLSGYGTFTLRIANNSTPAECSASGFSQTACGFVVEFVDIITNKEMNTAGITGTNSGGWPSSQMYSFINNDIYNSLPSDLKNVIINTYVVSGYGSNNSSNFTSTDNLYLLSSMEVWGIDNDTAANKTRQLDYYRNRNVSTSNYSDAIKTYQSNASKWWLRTPISDYGFVFVSSNGSSDIITARDSHGVAPAFRIG